jgi:hypothetical protein
MTTHHTAHSILNNRILPAHIGFSGQQPAAAPVIATLARRKHRVTGGTLATHAVVLVPAGQESPAHCALYLAGHTMRPTLYGPARQGDIYRTHRRLAPGIHAPGVEILTPAQAQTLLPVSDDEREMIRAEFLGSPLAELADEQPAYLDERVRSRRGDLSSLWWLHHSPWHLNEQQAQHAGMLHLASEHLYCGVREVHGRWEYYRGLWGHLIVEGVADTREEAAVMAQACLWAAWLTRVGEIREARCGDLSWGEPIGSPLLALDPTVGDPQREYGWKK